MVNAFVLVLAVSAAPAEASPAVTAAQRRRRPAPWHPPAPFRASISRAMAAARWASFPKNLGRSFVGVFSSRTSSPCWWAPRPAVLLAVRQRAQSGMGGFAPRVLAAASTAGGISVMLPAALGLFAAGRFAGEGSRFRAFTYDATQALIVNSAYTSALKSLTSRTRPDGSDRLSFPSGPHVHRFRLGHRGRGALRLEGRRAVVPGRGRHRAVPDQHEQAPSLRRPGGRRHRLRDGPDRGPGERPAPRGSPPSPCIPRPTPRAAAWAWAPRSPGSRAALAGSSPRHGTLVSLFTGAADNKLAHAFGKSASRAPAHGAAARVGRGPAAGPGGTRATSS